ncbi:MAG: RDD family protein [Verrucomicrobiota bacterium]
MSKDGEEPGGNISEEPSSPQQTNLLDSIFREDGPMPPAKIRLRFFAGALDIFLLTAVSLFIIWKIAIPRSHPGAFEELVELSQEMDLSEFIEQWVLANSPETNLSENLQQAATYAFELQLIIFWLYFAFGEAFFSGGTLGKRLLRIRTVSTVTLDKPPVFIGIVRGGTKTFLIFFPLAALLNLFALFFNKRKQMGHDLLSKTAVIDEKFVNLAPKS